MLNNVLNFGHKALVVALFGVTCAGKKNHKRSNVYRNLILYLCASKVCTQFRREGIISSNVGYY